MYSIELPPDIEERLIEEARERAITELEVLEAENGERSRARFINDDDLNIDWSARLPRTRSDAQMSPCMTSAASPRRPPSR